MSITLLKILALIFMTIDHIGQFIPDCPIWFHWIGRLSAPIFIFCMVWGYTYTKSKRIYIVRLYILSISMEIINYLLIKISYNTTTWAPYSDPENNIFATMFSICLLLSIIDVCLTNKKNGLKYLSIYILWQIATAYIIITYLPDYYQTVYAFFGNVLFVEGGLWLVSLGVFMYYAKNSKRILLTGFSIFSMLFLINSIFCISSRIVNRLPNYQLNQHFTVYDLGLVIFGIFIGVHSLNLNIMSLESVFYIDFQWMMIFSVPIIALYNGERGKNIKKFFYIYYPVHIYILWLIGNIIYNFSSTG